ncbi:MAG: UDP-N-acetylmuramoyl-L-alanyl-D-glutamate--2,6-diaminopimelate ligase [Actinomycetota bacterium]
MNLSTVGAMLGVPVEEAEAGIEISDLAYSSGQVLPETLFFCLRGSRTDGHTFASSAVESGAVALITEHPLSLPVPQLVVPDSRQAMNELAAPFFDHPSRVIQVAGVTGTNGKTTVTFMLDSIFRVAGGASGLVGTVEARVGHRKVPSSRTTPESIDLQRLMAEMVDEGVARCAVEVTSIGIDGGRVAGVEFDVAVFTNLTHDHLDHHGTMENYYQSKKRLFGASSPCAVINVDDEYGRRLSSELEGRVVTYSLEAGADLSVRELTTGLKGSRLVVAGLGFNQKLRVCLGGRFNAANALAAFGAAVELGIDPEVAAAGIESLSHVPGRLEPVEEGQRFHVFVDYAHTPDGLQNVLGAARGMAERRLIAVFGCGGDRDRAKRPLMGRAAERYCDLAIVTSDNPRTEDPERIIAEIVSGMQGGYRVVADRARAIREALYEAEPNDIVIIAGKGHETGQEADGVVTPFDDRQVVAGILREMA